MSDAIALYVVVVILLAPTIIGFALGGSCGALKPRLADLDPLALGGRERAMRGITSF